MSGKERDINIAFMTNSTLERYIKNNKSKNEKSQKSGICKLLCAALVAAIRYILVKREEHLRDVRVNMKVVIKIIQER